MPRHTFDPQDFVIDFPKEEFVDRMVNAFNNTYKGALFHDESLLDSQLP